MRSRSRFVRLARMVVVLMLVAIPVPGVQFLAALVLQRKRPEVMQVEKKKT